jgi:hypothetical protein
MCFLHAKSYMALFRDWVVGTPTIQFVRNSSPINDAAMLQGWNKSDKDP